MEDRRNGEALDLAFERLISQAARALAAEREAEADRLMASFDGVEYAPSQRHLDAMRALLAEAGGEAGDRSARSAAPRRRWMQWAACLALVAVVGGGMMATRADALRAWLRSFVYERFSTHTTITFDDKNNALLEREESEEEMLLYLPDYLPEGFVETDRNVMTRMAYVSYEKGGQSVSVQQMDAGGSLTAGVDTEDAYTEKTTVSGMEALYIEKNTERFQSKMLVFHNDRYMFIVHTMEMSREETEGIAQSLAPQQGGSQP